MHFNTGGYIGVLLLLLSSKGVFIMQAELLSAQICFGRPRFSSTRLPAV